MSFFFSLLMDSECHMVAGNSELHMMLPVLFSSTSKSYYNILIYIL